ncbi:MAG: carbohydrate ABC transporter permease [Chloroflexi bacterium]|nr:carbohydrate ABC transporter permease [Chloroflexota bacterium]
MKQTPWRRTLNRLLLPYLPLVFILFVLLFPFYWMALTSFKSMKEIFDYTHSPLWLQTPILDNYLFLFKTASFGRWSANSILTAVITTAFSLIVSIAAGYAIARLRFRGATLAGILIFITYLVPKTLLFIPLAQFLRQIHLLGDLSALMLVYPTFLIPFCAWLLTGYFRTVPIEPEECAMIDGCSRLGAAIRITLPMAAPGVLTAGIFAFTLSWNELLYALVFVSGEASKTLPVGLINSLAQRDFFNWGPLMAGATLGSIPVTLIYLLFMDLYVGGLTTGAVKG